MGEKTPGFQAWYGAIQATLRSLELVERDVENATGLPLASFEVLANLHFEEGERLRMSELADNLLLSRGGATRLVARLEEAGLVTREIPPTDRRATYAVLTEKGRTTLQEGMPALKESTERHFSDHLNKGETDAIRTASLKILEYTDSRCDWLVEALQAERA
jgi:DNA-binding MarR family transcriptional regulator